MTDVGDVESPEPGERGSNIYDLDRVNWQLSQICTDPDLRIVTIHSFDLSAPEDAEERKPEWE